MPIPFYRPKPAPDAAFKGQAFPKSTANALSRLYFHWVSPILKVGYSRPLQPEDLWDLPPELECQNVADRLEAQYQMRLPPSRRLDKYKPVATPSFELDKAAHRPSPQEPGANSSGRFLDSEKVPSSPTDSDSESCEILQSPIGSSAAIDFGAFTAGADLRQIDTRDTGLTRYTTRTRPAKRDAAKAQDSKREEPDPDLIKTFGKRKAKKIAQGKLVAEDGQTYDISLSWAMFRTMVPQWSVSVLFCAISYALNITTPLLTQKLIENLTTAHDWHSAQSSGGGTAGLPIPASIGQGMGYAVGIFAMQYIGAVLFAHSINIDREIGFKLRAAVIDLISRKSMRLSGKARLEMTNGRLTTMVTADASYLDWFILQLTDVVTMPPQIIVGIALLIYTLGYSALVGVAILAVAAPFQTVAFGRMTIARQAQQNTVDDRVRLLSEVLNNIRAVKLYAYENHFLSKIGDFRRRELHNLRSNGLYRSVIFGALDFIPTLAAVLTFVTYKLSGHELNAAVVFTGFQFYQILKVPIAMLPINLSALSDVFTAIQRIGVLFKADELRRKIVIDNSAPHAIDVLGDFQFDSAAPPDPSDSKAKGDHQDRAAKKEAERKAKQARKEAAKRRKLGLPDEPADEKEAIVPKPFALRDLDLQIPRGALVCIVGRVGVGKTALLSGLLNEMRQIRGHVRFGGRVSYVPQQAWVQSGNIRENITFSSGSEDFDQQRVDDVIHACGLQADIDKWQDGVFTKIGERGITLSGGQRQRICIARAAYDDSEIVLLDDPLSAVDANVGHHLLSHCILAGPFAHRTRILVTHQLDVLPKADLVLVMDRDEHNDGRIVQLGTYAELREQQGIFRTLMDEYGSSAKEKHEADDDEKPSGATEPEKAKGGGQEEDKGGKFTLDEERELGEVSWSVYTGYMRATGSWFWIAVIALLLVLTQAASIGTTLFLGFWSASTISGFSQGQYMAVYAAIGVVQALLIFASMFSMILAGLRASFSLFDKAWNAVMRCPTSWHDRTPTGRIISRLSKDIQMLDDKLAFYWNSFLTNALAVVGTFALIVYTYPFLALVFIPLTIYLYLASTYYRQTSRELKRIDSLLRSHIYSAFGEQLAGLSVIRAFGQQSNFEKDLQRAVNDELTAYILTIHTSMWLTMRLDVLSRLLLISIFGVIFRNSVNPAKFGVVLTYALASAQTFMRLVTLFAMCEQEMNNVERVQHYTNLELEAPPTQPVDPPANNWPTRGQVIFDNVELRYRPELPLVLKGISFSINPGEKVGIIGRTGAGKSSIAQALFRTVEICGGRIEVDGVDLKLLGLDTLRNRLSVIPQDAFLFGGTVRDNIDPTSARSDAELNDALNLIHSSPSASSSLREKFRLDASVQNEGANFSAGERQLLALMRALARGSKVLLLDEATSSVDPETDALIQRIIQSEFSDVTLISIAHRLQTVAYYDRILVMDAGNVVEFDSPLALFDNPESIFRSLCEKKHIGKEDLVKIRNDAAMRRAEPSSS